MAAQDFVLDMLVGALGIAHVVVGQDFRFGKGRAGDAAVLAYMGEMEGFGVTVFPPLAAEGGREDFLVAHPRRAARGPPGRCGALARPLVERRRPCRARRQARARTRLSYRQSEARRSAGAGLRHLRGPGARSWRDGARYDGVASFGLRPMFAVAEAAAGSPSVRFRRRALRRNSAGGADRLSAPRDEIRRRRTR